MAPHRLTLCRPALVYLFEQATPVLAKSGGSSQLYDPTAPVETPASFCKKDPGTTFALDPGVSSCAPAFLVMVISGPSRADC